jgi:flagellin
MYSLQSLLDINNKLATTQQRLSTGSRLNSAEDDPAGLTIATKMKARSDGLSVASDNISDAKNMLSVAESGLNKLTDILTSMRSKAEQAASDTLGGTERATIQSQLSQYAEQINDIIDETKWNGVKLLDGTVSKRFQTGVDEGEYTDWQLSVKHDPTALGVSTKVATDTAQLTDTLSSAIGGVATASLFSGVNKLSTGTYKIAVKDVAAGATTGNVSNVANNLQYTGTGVTMAAGTVAAGTAELSNGSHTFEIVGLTGQDTNGAATTDMTLSYRFDGGTTYTIALQDGVNQLVNGGGNAGLAFSVTDESSLTAASGTYAFDYVQQNTAEMQLQYQDGTAVSVDADGSAGTGGLATKFYVEAGATYDTGKGLTVTGGTILNMLGQANATSTAGVTFKAQSNYSVDVSSATTAASYMSTVTNAMDIVNQSLADLGSLMARMTIKEDVASSAKINVDASYSRIMDADMAEEQVNASKYQVLQQTAVAMLAQSNQAPQFLLTLFQ